MDFKISDRPRSSRWEFRDRLPSIAAIEAVAARRGVEPTEMDDNLHDYVDPDALDTLLTRSTNVPLAVEFGMGDEIVELRNDGEIDVRESGD